MPVMKNYKGIALLSLCILESCNVGSYNDHWPDIERIEVENGTCIVFNAEIQEESRNFVYAHHFYVYSDSILVTVNKPSTKQKVVSVTSLKTNQTIGEYLQYGNGPSEVLVVTDCMYGGVLHINDVAKHRVFSIDIDKIANGTMNQHNIDVFDYLSYGSTPYVIPLDDNSVLCENPFCFNEAQLKITNGTTKRFDRIYENSSVKGKNHYRFYTYNVSQGMLVPIKKNNLVFYASLSRPRIELYDTLGVRRKLFKGPTDLPIEYIIDNEDSRILFKDRIPYAFLGFSLTTNNVYFNYIGGYYEDGYENMHSTILKFDMEGNYLGAFVLPKYISSFTAVNDSLFYGKGYDQQGESVLWKFTAD